MTDSYQIQKDPYLQKVIKNILHSVPLDAWNFSGWINASDSRLGEISFTLTFSQDDKEHVNVFIYGGIRTGKEDVTWIRFYYKRDSRFYPNSKLECYISESDDAEGALLKVTDIIKCQSHYYQLYSERMQIIKQGTLKYLTKYIKKITSAWWCEKIDEDEENPLEELISCKADVDEYTSLAVHFHEDPDDDHVEIKNCIWGDIHINLDTIEIRQMVIDSICKNVRGNKSYLLQVINIGCVENNHELESKDFIIRTTKYFCAEYGHHLERIKAIIHVLTASGIKPFVVDAMYCPECDEYYISESEFNRIKLHGTLCHKVVTVNEYLKVKQNYDSWSDKSFLSSYGYSANEQDDLSDAERQRILAFIVENDIASASRVISFLEWLIRKRGERCYKACEKWERDVEFVRSYIPNGRYVIAKDIYKTNDILPF